ncbi:conjugal transfer protein TraH [Burkholderia sp. MBR-1]|uniref:conjugal transfer protein TraH n=1 Tax=Burkholderia sp. MBR-1 TaxID=2732364 RepID=UPI0015EEF5ED|nr:conjugal transfer protein TraH [Burkholderia sp. MBR-1]QMI49760.1 sex pilus assembly protein TraH [Burkholderia sp. MBR-1]
MKVKIGARVRKLTAALAIVVFSTPYVASIAYAGVSTQMDVMWNTTAARTYGNDMGIGAFGGNFTLRSPINTFTVMSFDPPHFDAGCGGIDMFLGSFSFMNGEQFKAMVRMIIQNAAGYLVHLAISAICNPCESIMAKLEKIMQELNSAQMNTCRISKMMVSTALQSPGLNGLIPLLGTAKDEVNQNALTAQGGFSDFMTAISTGFSSGNTSTNASQQDSTTDYANVVVNAVMTKNTLSTFSSPGIFGGNLGLTELLVSIFGTNVIQTTTSADASGSPGQDQSLPAQTFDPVLTFDDLVSGPGNTSKLMYNCTDWSDGDPKTCQHIKKDLEFSGLGFPGTTRYVVQQLAGDQGSAPQLAADVNADQMINVIQPGSIIFNIQNGQPLNPTQAAFLHALPANYSIMLLDAYQAGSDTSLYNRIAQAAAEDLAVSLGKGLLTILDTAFVPGSTQPSNGAKVISSMPDSVKKARETFHIALSRYAGETSNKRLERVRGILDAIKVQQSLMPRVAVSNK